MAFDPAKYIEANKNVKPAFDPEKYLASQKSIEPEKSALDEEYFGMTPRGLIKGTLATLPTIGTLAGGAVGGGLGFATPVPGGTAAGIVGGAGLGAAAGESLRQIGEKYLLDEGPKTTKEYVSNIAKEGLLGATSEMGGQALGAATKGLSELKPVQKLSEMIGKVPRKVGSALTGVSEKEIETYSKYADEINQLSKSTNNDVAMAADEIRGKFFTDIDNTRKAMNNKISKGLEASKEKIDISNVIGQLEKAKGKINAKLYPEQLNQIDDLVSKVKSLGTESDGKLMMSVQDANDVKSFLQDKASSSYRNSGDIFALGKDSAKAAKSAAADARQLINKAAPEVAEANSTLAKLHEIEDKMNLNLIAVGKPEAALLAAGTGGNVRNVKYLQQLGELTGTNMLGEAEKLAAMRTFGKPPLLPMDTTGKTLTRMAVGGGAGSLLGGPVGAAVGAGLSSPAALKAAIDAGLLGKEVLKSEAGRRIMLRGLLAPEQQK